MLPKEKRKPIADLSQEIILAYGIPKIGKSTFFSYFPNALFISTEEGLNHLEVFESPVKKWTDFTEIVRELEKDPTQFQTVVIDTVDNLYLFCRQFIYKVNTKPDKNGKMIEVTHETDMPYGKGWDSVDAEFRRFITALSQIKELGLVFISHSEEKEANKPGYKEPVTTISHTLPNRARKIIQPMADMILYMGFENGKRLIFTKPSGLYDAGDRSGRLPDSLPLDYEGFIKAYYSGNGSEGQARQEIIEGIQKGLVLLAELKIDGFEVPTRVSNSLKSNLGVTEPKQLKSASITLSNLQSYLQKLRAKFRQNGKKNKGEDK